MAQHMELVEEDADCRNMLQGGVTKGFPHIHDRQINAPGFLDPQLLEKQFHAFLGAILAAKPDGAPPQQVAHDDAVGVPATNGNFIDADHFGCRRADPA